MEEEKAKLCAKYDVGWWKAHGRRDMQSVLSNMSNLYTILFNGAYRIDAMTTTKSVKLRAQAGKEHDVAEELERSHKKSESEKHWKKAEELLYQSYLLL